MDFDKMKIERKRVGYWDSDLGAHVSFEAVSASDFDACHAELIATCRALEIAAKEVGDRSTTQTVADWLSEARTELKQSTTEENQ